MPRHRKDPVRTASLMLALNELGLRSIEELIDFSESELLELLSEYDIQETAQTILIEDYRAAIASQSKGELLPENLDDAVLSDSIPVDMETVPIQLGNREKHDQFGTSDVDPAELQFGEFGLRRHLLIVGSSGSGKTVAARYIVEQAALAGVPAIVLDCQGDLSSLVLTPPSVDRDRFLTDVESIYAVENQQDRQNIEEKTSKHIASLQELELTDEDLFGFSQSILPRIFTPKRPDVGLPVSMPPFSAAALTAQVSQADNADKLDLEEHYYEEIGSLVHQLFPRTAIEKRTDYEELIDRLVKHARESSLSLAGRDGIDTLLQLANNAIEIAPELFECNMTSKDVNNLRAAIRRCSYGAEQRWLEGMPLDIERLVEKHRAKTPINIFNVHGLADKDQHRVLRAIIGSVYRYGVQHPKAAGAPSLVLFIDEIGTGFGKRSVGKPSSKDHYQVFRALKRLVFQARKYGVCVMLASQSFTHFDPDMRTSLNTKIIGRTTDAAEQRRVTVALHEDTRIAGFTPESFVQGELPGLAPPRLIMQTVNGQTFTYHQNKCFSLDITLRTKDVLAWRNAYKNELKQAVAAICSEDEVSRAVDSGEVLLGLRNEYQFLGSIPVELSTALIRGQLRANDWDGALKSLKEVPDSPLPGSLLEETQKAVLSDECGRYSSVQLRVVELILDKWDGSPADLATAEQLRLSLLQQHIVSDHPEKGAISGSLRTLSSSCNPIVRIFANAWSYVTDWFCDWDAAWTAAISDENSPMRVYSKTETGAVEVTDVKRSFNEDVETSSLESQIERAPEDFSFQARMQSARGVNTGATMKHDEFRRHYEHIAARLREANRGFVAGNLRDAVAAIDAVSIDALLATRAGSCTEIQDLLTLDADPTVRRYRLKAWLDSLTWRQFEEETARLFFYMGYDAMIGKGSGDDGVDVYARKGSESIVIQCKHWKRQSVGKIVVQAIKAKADEVRAGRAVVVTSGPLEPGAAKWARRNSVEIIDGDRFIGLLQSHYSEQLGETCTPSPIAPGAIGSPIQPSPAITAVTSTRGSRSSDTLFDTQEPSLENRVLDLARTKRTISNQDVREALRLDSRKASSLLRKLCRDRSLVMVGATRSARYHLKKTIDVPSERSAECRDEVSQRSSGRIVYYNVERKFGRIENSVGNPDLYFFHINHLHDPLDGLFVFEGVSVSFLPRDTERGPQARDLRLSISPEERSVLITGRKGVINSLEASHAFVTDSQSDYSLYLPRTIVADEVWHGLSIGSEIEYSVVPSSHPDHLSKWEIAEVTHQVGG